MAKKAADVLTDVLHAAGVRRIYGLVGDSLNGITESLRRRGDIDWIHVRHEEVAAFAAGAEAQITGELAVCAGSCGPGNTHLINGLFDCQRTRVPVLAIAAQIPSAEIGRSYFQETKPEEIFRACSDFCEVISHTEQLPGVLETAIRSAIGRRSVSVVVIPGDVALEDYDAPIAKPAGLRLSTPVVTPAPDQAQALADLLNAGEKVTLFCGRGCQGAHAPLMRLAQALQAPIVHTLGGKEHIEWDNPFNVGMTGLIGFKSGYDAMHDCDTLLMLGTDFPYRQFIPQHVKIAQVDIRPESIGRRAAIDLGVLGDVAATIEAVLPRLKPRSDSKHLEHAKANFVKSRHGLDELASGEGNRGPIHPQYLTRLVSEAAAEDAVFTFDVGMPTIWAARHVLMNGRRRMVGSLNHGSMANALPQAIGVQASQPHRQVISLSGDGGLSMLMGDFLTLAQHNLPVKTIVFNNGTLEFVGLEMRTAGILEFATDLKNPDFAKFAQSAGIYGLRVESTDQLDAGVREVLAQPGPALLDVLVNPQELAIPPKITAEQAKGYSLWGMKAVMNGRGDEVVQLLKSDNMLKSVFANSHPSRK